MRETILTTAARLAAGLADRRRNPATAALAESSDPPASPTCPARTFNYTRSCWGHAIVRFITHADDFDTATACGFGPLLGQRLRTGDELLLRMERTGRKATERWRVTAVSYLGDPDDMWHAILAFVPTAPCDAATIAATRPVR